MTQYNNNNNPNATSFESQSSQLFRMASQDTELSYFRSLDIYEKYSSATSSGGNVNKAT